MISGIHRHDHPLRVWVPSQTVYGKEYLVDVSYYRFNGKCGCPHFAFRCEPELRRGALPGPLMRCNHIEAAREFLLIEMLKKISLHLTPEDEEIHEPMIKNPHGLPLPPELEHGAA